MKYDGVIREYALNLCTVLIASGLMIKLAPERGNKGILRLITVLLIMTAVFGADISFVGDDFSFSRIQSEIQEKTDEIYYEGIEEKIDALDPKKKKEIEKLIDEM